MRRGRPPYPDVLTPREQEVLTLIREGLTNDQIATRLGISESGARYHVSEILSKLGVESRYEAAQWAGEVAAPRRFALALPHLSPMMLAGGAIATTAVALVGLAVGVLIMDAREEESPPASVITSSPVFVTPIPTPTPDAGDQLTPLIVEEARNTYRFARAALASPERCQCDPLEYVLGQRIPLITTCKSTPLETRTSPNYVPALHGDFLDAVLEACQALDASTADTLIADATRVVALLEGIVLEDDARIQASNVVPQVVPTPLPRASVPPSGVYNTDVRTGNNAIDHALDLIFAGEWDQLANEANFRRVECTFIYAPGLLECTAGEPEGTKHGTFGVGSCSPGHLQSRSTLRDILASSMTSLLLYAAFEVDGGVTDEQQYLVLLRDGLNSRDRQVYLDAEGRLTASYMCGQWNTRPEDRTILPPPP